MDMYRLFARGYLGPNSTLADVHVVNAKDASAVGNSLATSDSCPAFKDVSGGDYVDEWDSIYLPPIVKRLNRLIDGNLTLDASDLSLFPYLCGFESQITRRVSAFCGVFRPDEILQYEYRQDLRYYYGTGKKSGFHMPSSRCLTLRS
jgi:acid phosphatase